MSLADSRPTLLAQAPQSIAEMIVAFDSDIPVSDVYRLILSGVQQEPWLVHGQLNTFEGACALGALNRHPDWERFPHGFSIDPEIAERIQEFNDSVPNASPEVRRALVIGWLKDQIALYRVYGEQ